MRQIEYDPVGFFTLFEHEGEQRWIPDQDLYLNGGTPEKAWALWTPETEAHRQRYLRKTEDLVRDVVLTAKAKALLEEFGPLPAGWCGTEEGEA